MVALSIQSIWQQLDNLDKSLFIKINTLWTNPVLDSTLPYFANILFWAPLFVFILVLIIINYSEEGWFWCISFFCTIALADLLSDGFIKNIVKRLSPCIDPALAGNSKLLLNHCNTVYSFTSTEAAIYFGLATFGSITLYPIIKRWIYLIYFWAIFISYAQVYVGVCYPLDFLGGAGLGVLAGLLTAWIFNKRAGALNLNNEAF